MGTLRAARYRCSCYLNVTRSRCLVTGSVTGTANSVETPAFARDFSRPGNRTFRPCQHSGAKSALRYFVDFERRRGQPGRAPNKRRLKTSGTSSSTNSRSCARRTGHPRGRSTRRRFCSRDNGSERTGARANSWSRPPAGSSYSKACAGCNHLHEVRRWPWEQRGAVLDGEPS